MNTSGEKTGAKMNNQLKIIVDADAIIAQANPDDSHYQKAVEISKHLTDIKAQIYYPVTAIAESNAYIQRVLKSTASAYHTAQVFIDPNLQVVEVDQNTIKNALNFFKPTTSQKNTLFDCIIAALAIEYRADAVFSFDKFYPKNGFKLASDLRV